MAKFRNVVNDGSQNAPRLRLQYNMWAASQLPRGGTEWTVPQRLDEIRDAGFTGFEASPATMQEADELAAMLRDRGLEIGFHAMVTEPDELHGPIERALRMGAQYMTAQVFGSLKSLPQVVETLEAMYELVNGAGLPFFVETHRGRVTQDLRRTVRAARRLKQLRFTGDFSHYVVAGEMGGEWEPQAWAHFKVLAERCGNWHGRISNGEQVQVDIGDGSGLMPQQFKRLWTMGFTAWLKAAQPGDVLPFCAELGPPGYSITDLDGREISDRWAQSLVIKRLAEEAWADAKKAVAV